MLKIDFDIDLFTTYVVALLGILLLLYVLLDVNYFIRVIFTVGVGRFFQDKLKVDDTSVIYGICTSQDLDIVFKHMNNARYLRDLDFARFHFYDKTGLRRIILGANAHVFQRATNIRYRRTIPFLSLYKIKTKVLFWDESTIYLEQQFITLNDGFVRAVVMSKQNMVGLNVYEVMEKLLGKDESYKPTAPEELELWMKSIDVSSSRLRKKD